ncbi:unnamed protein product [Rhodiola kirilowii]
MAVSEVELVLEFLRKNGLTEAESALKLDLKEKNEVEVLEFENFLFPMLPPVKIPASSQRWEGLGECSRLKSMSEDEFVGKPIVGLPKIRFTDFRFTDISVSVFGFEIEKTEISVRFGNFRFGSVFEPNPALQKSDTRGSFLCPPDLFSALVY